MRRRKSKMATQGTFFFFLIIAQVTRSVTVHPGHMQKAGWLPCQPLIVSVKTEEGDGVRGQREGE